MKMFTGKTKVQREVQLSYCFITLKKILTPCSTVLLEKLTGSQLVKKFPAFSEPEGSSPYPQAPATCPYPEPTPSFPGHCRHSMYLKQCPFFCCVILPLETLPPRRSEWGSSLPPDRFVSRGSISTCGYFLTWVFTERRC